MISSELVNIMFTSFARFVSKLTNKKVDFHQIKLGEAMMGGSQKIAKFLEDATNAFDNSEVKTLGALEPGKIYCLQVDMSIVNQGDLKSLAIGLREMGVKLAVIDQNMKFVSVPDGYEIKKKEKT